MSKTGSNDNDKPGEQNSALHPLVEMLTLQQLEAQRFRTSRHIPNHRTVLFGGQVLSQALVATTQTVSERAPHSLHGYFLRAGSSALPVDYEVQSLRDGGSFSTRRVDAIQEDKIIFTMDVSFHSPEPGISHQQALAFDVPGPEDCRSMQEYAEESPFALRGFVSAMNIMDMRAVSVDGYFNDKVVKPPGLFWFKMNGALPEDPVFHRCALALMSDRALMATCALQHPICMFDSGYLSASLDHAVWFHGDYPVNQWLLYVTESPWAGEGRGLNRGSIYTQDGMLVATTAQEGLIRKL